LKIFRYLLYRWREAQQPEQGAKVKDAEQRLHQENAQPRKALLC